MFLAYVPIVSPLRNLYDHYILHIFLRVYIIIYISHDIPIIVVNIPLLFTVNTISQLYHNQMVYIYISHQHFQVIYVPIIVLLYPHVLGFYIYKYHGIHCYTTYSGNFSYGSHGLSPMINPYSAMVFCHSHLFNYHRIYSMKWPLNPMIFPRKKPFNHQ